MPTTLTEPSSTEPPSSDDAGPSTTPVSFSEAAVSPVPNGHAPSGLFSTLRAWLRPVLFPRENGASLREALEEVIEEHDEQADITNPEERTLLFNVLEFGERTTEDIMIPRGDIFALPRDMQRNELQAAIIQAEHTRVPIYREDLDDIIGFIHIKDLLPHLVAGETFDIDAVLRPILVAPPSMKLIDLLVRMRLSRVHIAQVVDEYGGTAGLVTLEDVFEEIFGEIQDEHDEEAPAALRWISESTALADARTEIEVAEETLGFGLREDDEDFDTLGGLLFTRFGRVPKSGEALSLQSGLKLRVQEADARRILTVLIDTSRVRVEIPAHTPASGG